MEKRVGFSLLMTFFVFFAILIIISPGINARTLWVGWCSGCSTNPPGRPSGWPPSSTYVFEEYLCANLYWWSAARNVSWQDHGYEQMYSRYSWEEVMHAFHPEVPAWGSLDYHLGTFFGCGTCFWPWDKRYQVAYRCETCPVGWANCDKYEWNGCEVDIYHDEENCGFCWVECGTEFRPGDMCIAGVCVNSTAENMCASANLTWVKPDINHEPCVGSWENYTGCVADVNNDGLYDKKCCPLWSNGYQVVLNTEPTNLNPPCRVTA
jgi:hypothetical protein